jgi:hypothetical protein
MRATRLAALIAALSGGLIALTAVPAPAGDHCRAPKLEGLSVAQAGRRARADGCRLVLFGSRVQAPTIQTVRHQDPAPRSRTTRLDAWVNPLCTRTGAPGPPANEPILTPGPTQIVSGIFFSGGPLIEYSAPICTPQVGTPSAGTIIVLESGSGSQVAQESVASGELATFALPPGGYTLEEPGRGAGVAPVNVTLSAGQTVRQDLVVDIP